MSDFIPLLLLPIGLLITIILAKLFIYCFYFLIYLKNEWNFIEDKGYQKWKKKALGGKNESN